MLPAETLSVPDLKIQIPLCRKCGLWRSGFLSTYRASEERSSSTGFFGASFSCNVNILAIVSLSGSPECLSLWRAVPDSCQGPWLPPQKRRLFSPRSHTSCSTAPLPCATYDLSLFHFHMQYTTFLISKMWFNCLRTLRDLTETYQLLSKKGFLLTVFLPLALTPGN